MKILAFLFAALLSISTFANTTIWIGGDGDFSDPTHWDSGVPGSGDTAYVNNGSTVTISDNEQVDTLIISMGSTVQAEVPESSLVANRIQVGPPSVDDPGTFIQEGGAVVYTTTLDIGREGTYIINDTSLLDASTISSPGGDSEAQIFIYDGTVNDGIFLGSLTVVIYDGTLRTTDGPERFTDGVETLDQFGGTVVYNWGD